MRITNNIILNRTKSNINNNKLNVNAKNNQMSSQKKIERPSEDPVIAVRALRLRSSLSELDLYLNTNIVQVESWLDVTETSIVNVRKLLDDMHTLADKGANGPLTADDRNAVLANLEQIKEQIYSEANADYAGRTVFSGYKTNTTVTFLEDSNAVYDISEPRKSTDIDTFTYLYNQLKTTDIADFNTTASTITEETMPGSRDLCRLRLAYDKIQILDASGVETDSFTMTTTAVDGTTTDYTVNTITTAELEAEDYDLDTMLANAGCDFFLNTDTGELLMTTAMAETLNRQEATFAIDYHKEGFLAGEVKPEQYFNCTRQLDGETHEFTHYDADGNWVRQDINYTVAANQEFAVNLEINDFLDSAVARDINEMIEAVKAAQDAHSKVSQVQGMMKQDAYADDVSQQKLEVMLEAANKEATVADNKLQKLYEGCLGKTQTYITTADLAITDVGARGQRLDLTKNRVSSQYTTVEELKSSNEDMELSDVVVDYTAAYLAYQASLQAAAKVQEQTLLDYI